MAYFMLSEWESTNSEVARRLNGLEEMTYLNSYLESSGDEQQSWHITPNSTSPSSLGGITSDPLLSSTRYQWRVLFAAWKLATVSPDLQEILVFPKKEEPSIVPMASLTFRRTQKKNSLITVRMMYSCVKKSSSASLQATLLRNYASST